MPRLLLKNYIGIKELNAPQEVQFSHHLTANFDLSNFKISPLSIMAFKPILSSLASGWIIDGQIMITDEGLIVSDGFNWGKGTVGNLITIQNKKLNVNEEPNNLTIEGFTDEKGPSHTVREIDDNEISNSIFISGFNNLSHFMMEIAPKTLLFPVIVPKFPSFNTVTLGDNVPKKWVEYIIKTADSISESKSGLTINQIDSNKAVRFKNIIIISSAAFKSDNKFRMAVNYAKYFSQIMCKNAYSSSNENYILYMSRKNAFHRKTVNQENLIKIIEKIFPKLQLIVEENIHLLSMDGQAKLIHNANLIIEEGGGSTGFVSNLVGNNTPYVTIQTKQRALDSAKAYLAGLGKCAAWVWGNPVGELNESFVIDNDINVDETEFENLMIQLSLFIDKKIPMPKFL
tara:strand:+ start:251 stop:1453 length:1203 start_codon:yes stop_codon:yes gene_type:complete